MEVALVYVRDIGCIVSNAHTGQRARPTIPQSVASKGTPGDAKCVTEIHRATKIRKLRGRDRIDLFVSREKAH